MKPRALILLGIVALTSSHVIAGESKNTEWPTYHGDYSGRRYVELDQINRDNVQNLSLAWVHRLSLSAEGAIVGGEGNAVGKGPPVEPKFGGGMTKATPLLVDGVLYLSLPDNVWAVDARSGRMVWHYVWRSTGGIHVGNRGVGIAGDKLLFETPDAYLVSLNRLTGEERWHKRLADVSQEYFAGVAPLVIGNHVLVAPSGDAKNLSGFLEARDPDSGEVQWRWYTTPRGNDPAAKSWPSAKTMEHGGGMVWAPPTYDPQLGLLYVPTGNPSPAQMGDARRGANLWTASIVALDVDTGKMRWYFQCSPHDTHDWDANEVPVLFDANIDGQERKLVAQASRNGLYFLLDRVTGRQIVSAPFSDTANWFVGFDKRGQPVPDIKKEPIIGGALVSPSNGGATNWIPPTYSPQSGLLYVNTSESYSLYYRTQQNSEVEGSEGFSETGLGGVADFLKAIDVKTGKIIWSRPYVGSEGTAPRPEFNGGLMSTAGGLLFGGGSSGHLVAYDVKNGSVLWHSGLHAPMSNTPITYLLDGRQYVLVGADDSLYAFSIQTGKGAR